MNPIVRIATCLASLAPAKSNSIVDPISRRIIEILLKYYSSTLSVGVSTCVCVYVCMYVCMYVCTKINYEETSFFLLTGVPEKRESHFVVN